MFYNLKKLSNHGGVKIRALQYLFFFSTLYALLVLPGSVSVLALIVYAFLETIGGNIGLHRYLGHNSFETTKFIRRFLIFFAHYIGVGSALSWIGQHRIHHRYADTNKDVHSPYTNNTLDVIFGFWKTSIPKKLIEKELKTTDILWYHKNYFKLHTCIIFGYLLFDSYFNTNLFFILYAIPNFLCLMSGYILAYVTHYHGYKSYDTRDNSTNSWIANILTLGEGWHNNHHKYPNKWDTKMLPHEWDLPAVIIRVIKI